MSSGADHPDTPDAPPERAESGAPTAKPTTAAKTTPAGITRDDKLPIKMMQDRVLVHVEGPDGERRSTGGILIPATAQLGKRLVWAEARAVGPNVRNVEVGDQVLFSPEDPFEVEVGGTEYILLRERDVHAVAAERLQTGSTGLYL
jgi:chaperonin GroES